MKTTSEITLTDKNLQTELEREIYALTEIERYIRSALKMAGTNIRNAMILCEFVMSEYREQNLKLSSSIYSVDSTVETKF